jgi:aromatic ring-opening dioxygenase LigB subunit
VIAFAAIAPHGEVDETPELHVAMSELGRRFDASGCDVAVVLTPHNVHVEGHFAVVTAGKVGEHEVDRVLAVGLRDEIRAAGLPVVGVSYGGNDEAAGQMPLDWGTEVPLRFVRAARVVVVAPARDRPLDEHVAVGAAIARTTGERRAALMASADHGHAHDPEGPYGFDPAAAAYDARFRELLAARPLDFRPLGGEGRLALAARSAPGSGRRRSRAARVRDADLLRHGRRRDCLALTQPGCRAPWLQGLRSLPIARRSRRLQPD